MGPLHRLVGGPHSFPPNPGHFDAMTKGLVLKHHCSLSKKTKLKNVHSPRACDVVAVAVIDRAVASTRGLRTFPVGSMRSLLNRFIFVKEKFSTMFGKRINIRLMTILTSN